MLIEKSCIDLHGFLEECTDSALFFIRENFLRRHVEFMVVENLLDHRRLTDFSREGNGF